MSDFFEKHKVSKKAKDAIPAKLTRDLSFQKRKSFFQRCLETLTNVFHHFFPAKKQLGGLVGRAEELHATADELVEQVRKSTRNLEQKLDKKIMPYLELIVAPLFREVETVQKMLSPQASITQQAKAWKRFHLWREHVEDWLSLCQTAGGQDGIVKGIMERIEQDSIATIEKDLQIIADYYAHIVEDDSMPTADSEEELLKKNLEECQAELRKLKEIPSSLTLDQVTQWKREVDRKRQLHFDKALHAVDLHIDEMALSSLIQERERAPSSLYEKTSQLEERLLASLERKESKEQLEQEIHALNADLRLDEELSERVEKLMKQLSEM